MGRRHRQSWSRLPAMTERQLLDAARTKWSCQTTAFAGHAAGRGRSLAPHRRRPDARCLPGQAGRRGGSGGSPSRSRGVFTRGRGGASTPPHSAAAGRRERHGTSGRASGRRRGARTRICSRCAPSLKRSAPMPKPMIVAARERAAAAEARAQRGRRRGWSGSSCAPSWKGARRFRAVGAASARRPSLPACAADADGGNRRVARVGCR